MSPVPDFYGVPLVSITTQVDTITASHTAAVALSKAGIVSYPSQETAGASPTADVITVYDVTTSHALALGTDYTLTASGSSPETQTYSVLRVNTSSLSSDGDTWRVTYRFGTVPDSARDFGDFQGEAGAAPTGTAFQASNQPTTGSVTAGIGEQGAGGSLTDPAAKATGSETGAPGSEYTVSQTHPAAFGYSGLGSPDTEGVYGGTTLPENFVPTDTSLTSTSVIDTTVAGGSNLVPSMYSSPPGYRAPSAGIAAGVKDTTLTDILGNQVNASASNPPSGYSAVNVDTGYIGSPAAPTALATQTDAFSAAAVSTPYYLTQSGVVPSSITARDTTASANLVLNTDYTVTVAGNGPTTNVYVQFIAGTNFTAGHNTSVTYNWGDPTYWDSNPPASVPAAPTVTNVTAVNRGVKVTWSTPSGTTYIQYYLVQSSTLGTMYVPFTGQPVLYGQSAPSGGASIGQPTFQSDTFTAVLAALAAPAAPGHATATTGGTILAGTYTFAVTYVNANGETVASATATQVTTGSTSTLTINSPSQPGGATGWYAYVSQVGGTTLTRQQAAGSPTAIGTNLTLTAPPTSTGANPPTLNTTVPTTTQKGVLTPPAQVVVRDLTSAESDPMQPTGTVLEYGYDYTVTTVGVGPWTQYQIAILSSSVNAAPGDSLAVDYWWGADPSSVSTVFTQGLVQNTAVIYKPDGTTPYNQGYAFRVAAGNQIGLGPYSAWSSYAVPLNYNEPQSNGSITVGTGSLDPANTINPVYKPDGTIHAGTGLGG